MSTLQIGSTENLNNKHQDLRGFPLAEIVTFCLSLAIVAMTLFLKDSSTAQGKEAK